VVLGRGCSSAGNMVVRSALIFAAALLACSLPALHGAQVRLRREPRSGLQILMPSGGTHDDEKNKVASSEVQVQGGSVEVAESSEGPASNGPAFEVPTEVAATRQSVVQNARQPAIPVLPPPPPIKAEKDAEPTATRTDLFDPKSKPLPKPNTVWPPEDVQPPFIWDHCQPPPAEQNRQNPHLGQDVWNPQLNCKFYDSIGTDSACVCQKQCETRFDCVAWVYNGAQCMLYNGANVGPEVNCMPYAAANSTGVTWSYNSAHEGCFDFHGAENTKFSGSELHGGNIIQRISNRKGEPAGALYVTETYLNCCMACRLSPNCVKYVKHSFGSLGQQCDLYDLAKTGSTSRDDTKKRAKFIRKNNV